MNTRCSLPPPLPNPDSKWYSRPLCSHPFPRNQVWRQSSNLLGRKIQSLSSVGPKQNSGLLSRPSSNIQNAEKTPKSETSNWKAFEDCCRENHSSKFRVVFSMWTNNASPTFRTAQNNRFGRKVRRFYVHRFARMSVKF